MVFAMHAYNPILIYALASGTGATYTTTITTILRPFVRDYPGELVPEKTYTHSHLS